MFSKINAYLALILAVQLKYLKCEESAAFPTLRIVGGTRSDIESLSYLVGIHINNVFYCGGSLITSKCVLTAAHCVHGNMPRNVKILAGSETINDGISRRVKTIFLPKSYNPYEPGDMDVAVVKLSKPFPDRVTKIIDIDYTPVRIGDTILTAGWGSTSDGGTSPKQLRSVNLTTISDIECKKMYSVQLPLYYTLITSNMFCAQDRGKDTCQGDSGGPAVRNGQQVGIISWGKGCAVSGYASVYTKLSSAKVKSFIDRVIKNYC